MKRSSYDILLLCCCMFRKDEVHAATKTEVRSDCLSQKSSIKSLNLSIGLHIKLSNCEHFVAKTIIMI